MELNEKQQEKLQKLLMEFMTEKNIKIPEDTDFVLDTIYYEMVSSIEEYLKRINNIEVE
jgi:chromosomal replication initiation ATPase DnaA